MKQYVKVYMEDKKILSLPLEQWESILADKGNLVAYKPQNATVWDGTTINKLRVIRSEPDVERAKIESKPKFTYYRHKETGRVLEVTEGELPDRVDLYEAV